MNATDSFRSNRSSAETGVFDAQCQRRMPVRFKRLRDTANFVTVFTLAVNNTVKLRIFFQD